MTREQIYEQYIPCFCQQAYKDRGLEDPHCPYHNSDPDGLYNMAVQDCIDKLTKDMNAIIAAAERMNILGNAPRMFQVGLDIKSLRELKIKDHV